MCAQDGLRRNTGHTPDQSCISEREGKVLALVDVRRAFFFAPARRKVFVELPPEDYQPGDEHMCGLLRYSLYGTRDAAQNGKRNCHRHSAITD